MMISPETFYEMELKGKNEKEILTIIRGLKQRIGRLKNTMEHPEYMGIIEPSEDVQIHWTREYLNRAKEALSEVGGTYIPSKAEQKAIEFDANINNIQRIVFEIGGYFSGRTEYVVYFSDNEAVLSTTMFVADCVSDSISKDYFLDSIKSLYIGEWRKYYRPERFGYYVLDGTQWSLKFIYNDGKSVEYGGSNSFPYNFSKLQELFGIEEDYDENVEEE